MLKVAQRNVGRHSTILRLRVFEHGTRMESAIFADLGSEYALNLARFVDEDGVSIVGGCCGTGADHIRALTARLAG